MKNKKTKSFLIALFAFSLALSGGSLALLNKHSQPVHAEELRLEEIDPEETSEEAPEVGSSEEDDMDTPVSSSDSEETPIGEDSSSSTPTSTSTETTGEKEEAKTTASMPTWREISSVIKHTFIDAWKDLVAHIKKWFKRG